MDESRYISGKELAKLCDVTWDYFRQSKRHGKSASFLANVPMVGSPRKIMYRRADALAWKESAGIARAKAFKAQSSKSAKLLMSGA